MTQTPKVFLIVFNRASRELVEFLEFDYASRDLAEKKRFAIELEAAHGGTMIEAVILVANSEDELRKTHSGYFKDVDALVTATSALPK